MTNQTVNSNGSLFYDESRKKWRLQIAYYSPTGELKRKSFSGDSKKDVIQKKKQFEYQITMGHITETSYCTIVDLIKEKNDYDFSIGDIREAAYVRRQHTLSIIEKSQLGKTQLSQITEKMINAFLMEIRSQYSNSVIKKVYGTIRKAYHIALSKRLISYNLMDSPFIKKPKSTRPDTKVRAFSCEEQQVFLNALKDKKPENNRIDYKPILYIALFTGMRMGEILALKPDDIDLKNGVIHVRGTITRGVDYEIKVGDETKTAAGQRDVPINTQLKAILPSLLKKKVTNKEGLLFYNYNRNGPVSTQNVNEAFKRLCKKAGLQISGGQHLLRHTFVTRCIEADIPVEVIMRWVGHKDVSTTINTYADVFAKRNNSSIEKLSLYYDEFLII